MVDVSTNTKNSISVNTNAVSNVSTNTNNDYLLSKSWAVGKGLIQNEDYSSKYYAQRAKASEEIASSAIQGIDDIANQAIEDIETVQNEALENLETAKDIKITEINDTAGDFEDNLTALTQRAESSAIVASNASTSASQSATTATNAQTAAENAKDAADNYAQQAQAAKTQIEQSLINYYTKSETYSKTEVNNLIASIPQFSVVIVQTLPQTGQELTLYLVPKEGEVRDVYNEYIWVTTSNSFELIGSTSVNLDGYATEDWVLNQHYLTRITSSDVVTALGYTPYNSTNPNGYITGSALINYVTNTSLATTLADYALSADIPTKTSDLTNDSNFATVSQIPTNNNQLTNGAGYITNSALNGYATEAWVNNQGFLISSDLAEVALSGDFEDLINQPSIPTDTGDLTNNAGFIKNKAINAGSLTLQGTSTNNVGIVNIGGGSSATASVSTALGANSEVSATQAVAIGYNSNSGARNASALGSGATISTGAISAIQLGYGTNSTAKTLSVGFYDATTPTNYELLDGTTGLIPSGRIPIDNSTITVNSSGQLVASGGGGSTPTNMVTTDTVQDITAKKTFIGDKAINFKQSTTADKLGFTLFSNTNSELAAFEFRPSTIGSSALFNLNLQKTSANYVGFRYHGTNAINVACPKVATAGNYYIPINFTNGTNTVTATNVGTVNISTLIPTIATSVNSSSTNTQTVGAKLFYDTVGNIETLLANV